MASILYDSLRQYEAAADLMLQCWQKPRSEWGEWLCVHVVDFNLHVLICISFSLCFLLSVCLSAILHHLSRTRKRGQCEHGRNTCLTWAHNCQHQTDATVSLIVGVLNLLSCEELWPSWKWLKPQAISISVGYNDLYIGSLYCSSCVPCYGSSPCSSLFFR